MLPGGTKGTKSGGQRGLKDPAMPVEAPIRAFTGMGRGFESLFQNVAKRRLALL